MKGEIELYNISFLILKVNLHFKCKSSQYIKLLKYLNQGNLLNMIIHHVLL